MSDLFLKLFNMSVSAGWLALAVILVRLLFKKAPRRLFPVLWTLVGIRLLLPFTLESALSLIPSAETVRPDMLYAAAPALTSGLPAVDSSLSPALERALAPSPGDSVNPMQVLTFAAAVIWLLGMAAMLVYAAASTVRLRRRMREAVQLDENVWLTDRSGSPFVLGIVRPRIYIPYSVRDRDLPFVLAHERAHIARRDHWIKPAAFLLLSVYWFNPVLWAAYILLCRDVELACDERVVKDFTKDQRADYSEALLSCSVPRHRIAACPLAFGEVGVRARVKSVLNYKKPAFWAVVLSVVSVTVLAVCFLTNPAEAAIKNPAVGEYEAGADGIVGNVNTSDFTRISPDFAVGADRHGVAVFQNPRRAWETFRKLYHDPLEELEELHGLKPLSAKNRSDYKKLAAQTETEDPEKREQYSFISRFLDIYENSFTDHGDVPAAEPTAESAEKLLPDDGTKIAHAAVTRTPSTPHRAFEGEFADRLRLRVWYEAEKWCPNLDPEKIRAEIWSVEEAAYLEPEENCRAECYLVKSRYRTAAGDWTNAPDLFFMAFTAWDREHTHIGDFYVGGPVRRDIPKWAGSGYLADYGTEEEALLMRMYDENRYMLSATSAVDVSVSTDVRLPASLSECGEILSAGIASEIKSNAADLFFDQNRAPELIGHRASVVVTAIRETVPVFDAGQVHAAGYEVEYKIQTSGLLRDNPPVGYRDKGSGWIAPSAQFLAIGWKSAGSGSPILAWVSSPVGELNSCATGQGWNGIGDPAVWLVTTKAVSWAEHTASPSGEPEFVYPDTLPLVFPDGLDESVKTGIGDYLRVYAPFFSGSGGWEDYSAVLCEAEPTLLYTEKTRVYREYGGILRHFTLECYSVDLRYTLDYPERAGNIALYDLEMKDGYAVPSAPMILFLAAEETDSGVERYYIGKMTSGGLSGGYCPRTDAAMESSTSVGLRGDALQSWMANGKQYMNP